MRVSLPAAERLPATERLPTADSGSGCSPFPVTLPL
jgi:hypothetical protein